MATRNPRPTPGPPPVARVAELLRAIGTESAHLSRHMAGSSGVGRTDFDALTVLIERGEPMPTSELARSLDLSSAAATSLIDRLEAVGHVARERDDHDRRRIHVRATDLATDTAGEVIRPFVERLVTALAEFPDDDLDATARVLEQVVEVMRQGIDGAPTSAAGNPAG